MERMVLTNLAPDFFGIETLVQRRISFRTVWSKVAVNKIKKKTLQNHAALKEIEFGPMCNEFGTCQDICRNFSATPQKCAQHVLRFPEILFSSTQLVELLLWLDKPGLIPTTVQEKSWVILLFFLMYP